MNQTNQDSIHSLMNPLFFSVSSRTVVYMVINFLSVPAAEMMTKRLGLSAWLHACVYSWRYLNSLSVQTCCLLFRQILGQTISTGSTLPFICDKTFKWTFQYTNTGSLILYMTQTVRQGCFPVVKIDFSVTVWWKKKSCYDSPSPGLLKTHTHTWSRCFLL